MKRIQSKCREGWDCYAGQWLEFEDQKGMGCACPDLYLVSHFCVVVFEVKYSAQPFDKMWAELRLFYATLLEQLHGLPIVMCQVFRNFRPEIGGEQVNDLTQVLRGRPERLYQWQLIL